MQLTDGNRTGYNLWVNLKKEFGQGDSMYTLKDVAARAGVSPTIVSYVLNNSNYVSAEKRAAVLKAVKELNYHINCNARGLRKKKTSNIAVITFDERSELYSEIVYYLEQLAYREGFFISVSSINTVEKANSYLTTLMSQKYDGIIMLSNPFNPQQIRQLLDGNLPIVLLELEHAKQDPMISILKPNTYESVRTVMRRFIAESGHSRIGYITFGNPTATGEEGPYGQGLRVKAYLDSMADAGLEIPYAWILQPSSQDTFPYFAEEISEIVQQYTATPAQQRPTAFFTSIDSIGAMLVTQLCQNGIDVPGDVEVFGFGGSHSSEICCPPLSTIHLDCKDTAQRLMEMFLQRYRGEDAVLVETELTIKYRGSTQFPR